VDPAFQKVLDELAALKQRVALLSGSGDTVVADQFTANTKFVGPNACRAWGIWQTQPLASSLRSFGDWNAVSHPSGDVHLIRITLSTPLGANPAILVSSPTAWSWFAQTDATGSFVQVGAKDDTGALIDFTAFANTTFSVAVF
jgi:hypothetical protein